MNPENDPYKRWPADSKATRNNPHLAAQLSIIDNGIGQILKQLKALGIAENTIIIFTSDNGGETTITTNAPLRGGKSMLYEGGVREPFLIWNPVLFSPAVNATPFSTYDLYPTLIDLVGAAPNKQKFDGISIAPVLKNSNVQFPERRFYWHYPLNQPHFLGGRSAGSIREGDWKMIEFFDDKSIELYNLKDDISESNNLANKFPEKIKHLSRSLRAWRNSVAANK